MFDRGAPALHQPAVGLRERRVKPLFVAIVSVVVVMLVVAALLLWSSRPGVDDKNVRELQNLTQSTKTTLAQWHQARSDDLRALARSGTLVQGLGGITRPGTTSTRIGGYELGAYLRAAQTESPWLLELTVTDADGRILVSSASVPRSTLPEGWRDSASTEQIIVSPPGWDDSRGKAALTFTVPIVATEGDRMGLLIGVVDMNDVQAALQKLAHSSNVDVVLVADNGKPLVSARALAATLRPVDPDVLVTLRQEPGHPLTYLGHHRRDAVGVADLATSPPAIIVAEKRSGIFNQFWRRIPGIRSDDVSETMTDSRSATPLPRSAPATDAR